MEETNSSPHVVPTGDGFTKSRTATFFPRFAASFKIIKQKQTTVILSMLVNDMFSRFHVLEIYIKYKSDQ